MSPGDLVSVCPGDIRFKLSHDLDLGGVQGGDWDIVRRVDLTRTAKFRSIRQHFVDGVPWLETELFRESYERRFSQGDHVRTAPSIEALARQYVERVDSMYESLKTDGFLLEIGGRAVPLPKVHVGRDGEVFLGNQGNHRLAIAQLIGLAEIIARVHTLHAEFSA